MSQGVSDIISLGPPGPVAAAYEAASFETRFIMGPVGSGKTTTCGRTMVRQASREHRSPVDGVRRCKWLMVGSTYANIEANFLQTWFRYFPKEIGHFTGMPLMQHEFAFNDQHGRVEFSLLMRAIGEHRVEDVLRGLEVTHAYLFELDLQPLDIMNFLPGRIGRFPGATPHGPPKKAMIIGDTNAPDEDSVWYAKLFDDRPDDWKLFIQPGGREPNAENVQNLPAGYYERQVKNLEPWAVRRLIDNIPGMSRAGMPVYAEYNDGRHYLQHDAPVLDRPLIVGADQGLHPAFVVLQRDDEGRVVAQDCLTGGAGGEDALEFGERVRALLSDRYRGLPIVRGTADPAGWKRSEVDKTASWSRAFAQVAGIKLTPASTNQPELRQAALRNLLRDTLDGVRPAFALSNRCPVLRRGLVSGYRRKKAHQNGGYYVGVEKNEWSHPVEALEYAVLGAGGLAEAMQRRAGMSRNSAPVIAPSDFAVV